MYPSITVVIVSITGVTIGTFLLHRVVATAAMYVATAATYMGRAFMVSSFLGIHVVGWWGVPRVS
jgi:hypothetical protein